MSDNKSIKNRMVRIYGAECWIDKLQLRPPEDRPRRYTSQGQLKRMKQLTYHHIKPKSKGGKATLENGAILSAENHAWFHKQPPEIQSKLNQIFQEYKNNFGSEQTSTSSVTDISYDIFIEKAKKHYDRAKEKRKTQKLIEEDNDLIK